MLLILLVFLPLSWTVVASRLTGIPYVIQYPNPEKRKDLPGFLDGNNRNDSGGKQDQKILRNEKPHDRFPRGHASAPSFKGQS
jgi:hypothetical protein